MVNRKDFRPTSNTSRTMSEHDRQTIRQNRQPVMPKRKVVDNFIKGEGAKTGNNTLSTNGKELKSYNTVIATRQENGVVLVNNTKYSRTTSSQQSILMQELAKSNTKYEVTGGKDRGYQGEDFSKESDDEKHMKEHRKSMQDYRNKLEITKVQVPRGSGNNPAGGKTDTHYKIVKYGYIFPTRESAEHYANTHHEVNGEIVKNN